MECFHMQVIILWTAAVSAAQLSPSGDVQVCLGAVVELTCNINRSRSHLDWRMTLPMMIGSLTRPLSTSNLPVIGMPLPQFLPGSNLTIQNVTDTSIVSSLTVDTSSFDITDAPIVLRCAGADGETSIRNFGPPVVEAVFCTHHETRISDSSQVSLSWSLSDGLVAPVDSYILTLTPSPPSLTPSLITITTTTSTATLTVLSNVTYSVRVTADSCVGRQSTTTDIRTNLCNESTATSEQVTTIITTTTAITENMTDVPQAESESSLVLVVSVVNALVLVAGVIVNITVCATMALCISRRRKSAGVSSSSKAQLQFTMEMSPGHTEHVQSEEHGQGDPMYDDILPPHAKEKETVIELEENVAYSIANKQKHHH